MCTSKCGGKHMITNQKSKRETMTNSESTKRGTILKGIGGLYEVRLESLPDGYKSQSPLNSCVLCRARGVFRHNGITPLPGDTVDVLFGEAALGATGEDEKKKKKGGGAAVSEDSDVAITAIRERKNHLIRPPLANIDILFIVIPAAQPAPILETADKLVSIADHNEIEPVVIITKSDLAPEYAAELCEIYRKSGFSSFAVSSVTGEGVSNVMKYILAASAGTENKAPISAFAGASGAGKSTLMNELFPQLKLVTGGLSKRIERGKHTTREVTLYPLSELFNEDIGGYLADTPGFSMLDFTRFDFFRADQLPFNFREFAPYLGKCRYTKCTHLKEDGCLIRQAVKDGIIQESRYKSYLMIYDTLKQIPDWKRKGKDE